MLACGQCFRWKKEEPGEWIGVIGKRIWILKQDSDQLFYRSIGEDRAFKHASNPAECGNSKNAAKPRKSRHHTSCPLQPSATEHKLDDEEATLKDYFQLSVDLDTLYTKWSKNDQFFNKLSQNFGGLRMLRQDPVENLFSFICSQNNHISRIASMVEKLCTNYGQLINTYGGRSYFTFPQLSALAKDGVEENLRELGFGYRAKFINHCAKKILTDGGDEWLHKHRAAPYKEAHSGTYR